MSDYEIIMQIFMYNIMAGCETGGCAYFHLINCHKNRKCFYDGLYRSAIAALDSGYDKKV